MRALLDVGFLVALRDSQHERHDDAVSWLADNSLDGWASCPITENGCVRILSQARYPGGGGRPEAAMRLLENLIALGNHRSGRMI